MRTVFCVQIVFSIELTVTGPIEKTWCSSLRVRVENSGFTVVACSDLMRILGLLRECYTMACYTMTSLLGPFTTSSILDL